MEMMDSVLGHSTQFWLELERSFANSQGVFAVDLLEEVVMLRGRVSYYEDRIRQMHSVMQGK